MSRLWRHFLMFLAIFIFFVSSPLIILYSQGYRFNWSTLEFTKTGTINIKTIPRGANIYLNYKNYKKLSPTKIDALKPKTYHLKITKEGYKEWEADLKVKPELVASATHIILFPEIIPEKKITSDKIANFKLSSDNKAIIYNVREGKNKGIWLLNLENRERRQLSSIYFDEFSWSPDNKKILLTRQEEKGIRYGLVDISVIGEGTPPKILDLASLFQGAIQDIAWQPENSKRLYLINNKNLYEIDLRREKITLLFKDILSFSLNPPGFLFIQENKNGIFLMSWDYRVNNIPQIACPLPEREEYKIIAGAKKIAVLAQGDLYLVEKLPLKITPEVDGASWSPDGKRLLYFNEHQIGIYYLKDESKSILTRDSRPLQNVGWWPRSQYAVFTVEGKIKFIDAAPEMNTHYITEIKDTGFTETKIDWNKNTKKLFYLTQMDPETRALMEMELIED